MSDKRKELLFSTEAREKILRGVQLVTNQIAFLYGGYEKEGVEHAYTGQLKDQNPFEKIGSEITKQAMCTVEERCGDGRITTALLMTDFVEKGIEALKKGAGAVELNHGIAHGVAEVVGKLNQMAKKVVKAEEIVNLANTAIGRGAEVGVSLAEALRVVGLHGDVVIEPGEGAEVQIDLREGIKFPSGYANPYFVNDEQRLVVEFPKARILLVDRSIPSPYEILPVLREMIASGENLLVIAKNFEGDTLSTLVMNKMRQLVNVAAVKVPEKEKGKPDLFERLSRLTGAKVVGELDDLQELFLRGELLGYSGGVRVDKNSSLILHAEEKDDSGIEPPCQEKIAILHIGSEERAEDYRRGLKAVQNGIESGYLTGGGMALYRCGQEIGTEKGDWTDAEWQGLQIVKAVCEAPLRQIIRNSGHSPERIIDEIRRKAGHGWNMDSGAVEDLLTAGVIDSLKSIKLALETSAREAQAILLTETVLYHL